MRLCLAAFLPWRSGLDRSHGARGGLDPFSHTDNLYSARLAGGVRDIGLGAIAPMLSIVEPLELSYYSDDDDDRYNEVDPTRWCMDTTTEKFRTNMSCGDEAGPEVRP